VSVSTNNSNVKVGSSFTLTASANSGNDFTWYKNNAKVGTGSTFTIAHAQKSDAAEYKAIVKDGSCVGEASITIAVNNADAPTINTQPASQTATVGDNVTFSIATEAGCTYQWYKNGVQVGTGNTYTINGVSKAWQHHKGRNTHHWQYWLDNTKDGIVGRLMPFEDCLEMLCDQFAAGMTYKGSDWSIDYQRNWWDSKIDSHSKYMHPVVFKFMNGVYEASFEYFDDSHFIDEIFNYNLLEDYYYDLKERWEDEEYVN
jgi:hypothetical protein